MNILVIESDSNKVKETLDVFNRSQDDNVFVVADGRDALNYIDHNGKYIDFHKYPQPEFVLLGVNMHRGIGLLLQEELRGRNIPVFLPPIK